MPDLYFLLTMAAHGLVSRERQLHGTNVPRYLNAVGRWAGSGKKVPLLVWSDRDEAQAAAAIATAARKKPVSVTQAGNSSWQLGKSIRIFTNADDAALAGYADKS